jgi:hypothetical protein
MTTRRRPRAFGLASALLATIALATVTGLGGPTARAQSNVGGAVPALIALSIGTPTDLALTRPDAYALEVPVEVSSTVDQVRLSVGDGEDFAGPAHGRLHDGGHLLAAPLEVAIGGGPPQSLAAPTDPLLKTWNGPTALAPAEVVVSQHVAHRLAATQSLQKVVLITVSTDTP